MEYNENMKFQITQMGWDVSVKKKSLLLSRIFTERIPLRVKTLVARCFRSFFVFAIREGGIAMANDI